jgi:hypothetical protein
MAAGPSRGDTSAHDCVGVSPKILVNKTGDSVDIGLVLANGVEQRLTMSAALLGVLVNTLQLGAREALQRRVAKDPANAYRDPRTRRANPVRQIDMELDAAGRAALWRFTEHDGTSHEAQISLELLEGLVEKLPNTIEGLKKLRAGKAAPN